MRMCSTNAAVVVCLLALPPLATRADQPATQRRSLLPGRPGRVLRPGKAITASSRRAPGVVGTLQYDNDIPFQRDGSANVIGNRFNTGFSNPHSIASFSFRPGGAAGGFWIGGVLDVNPTAMTLTTIGAAVFTGIPPGTVGSMVFVVPLSTPVVGHSGSFLGGVANYPVGSGCPANTMLGAPCNGVALSAGTMDPGMGLHGVRVNTPATTGVNIPQNAIFRVTGDNLPVELMRLGVE